MKKKVYSLLLLLLVVLLPISFVKAEGDYFKVDSDINDSNSYNHSVFIAGKNVKSNGEINGIGFAAGSSVELNGSVSYGAVAGESVTISANVKNDLFAAGNEVKIDREAILERDAYIAGNDVRILSNISGNAFVGANILYLDNVTINGDLNVSAGQLEMNGNVVITGKLIINDNAVIKGENNLIVGSKEIYKNGSYNISFRNKVIDLVLSILALIFAGIVLIVIFPKLFDKIEYELKASDIFKKILCGLGLLIIVPALAIISLIIEVGVLLAGIIFALYIIALFVAVIFASYIIGNNIYTKLFKQKENVYIGLIIGVLLIKIIGLIPVVGSLVEFFAFLYGLGIICSLFLNRNK